MSKGSNTFGRRVTELRQGFRDAVGIPIPEEAQKFRGDNIKKEFLWTLNAPTDSTCMGHDCVRALANLHATQRIPCRLSNRPSKPFPGKLPDTPENLTVA